MKMNKCLSAFCIILMSLICLSCNNNKSADTIKQSDFVEKEADLSSLVKSVRFIKLDNQIPLQFILKIIGFDNKLLLLSEGKLLLFNADGKYIRQIGSQGHGPGEFLYARDMAADISTNNTWVLARKTVMIFDIEGTFIRSFVLETEAYFRKIMIQNDLVYLFADYNMGKMENTWIILNKDGNILKERKNYLGDFESIMTVSTNPVFFDDQEVYYFNLLNDTIFSLNGLNCKPGFIFKFQSS